MLKLANLVRFTRIAEVHRFDWLIGGLNSKADLALDSDMLDSFGEPQLLSVRRRRGPIGFFLVLGIDCKINEQ